MSDDANAPVAEVSYAVPADAPAEMSVSEAARMLSRARQAKLEQPAESAPPPEATADPELVAETNAAPPVEDPGTNETQEPDPAEMPPIEPPRSWTKAEKEAFSTWPREAQESISRVASTREAEFRRSQNEAAEARRAFEAQMAQAEQIRKDYEQNKLPALSKALEAALQNEFADIQSFIDIEKMQTEDPFRYQRWDLHQKRLAVVKQEEEAVRNRHESERMTKRSAYENEQAKKLIELAPEMGDQKKAAELRDNAVKLLTDDRFTMDQLQRWIADDTGHEILSSSAFQKMVLDLMNYEEAKQAPLKAIPKPVPPVQRPGVARSAPGLSTQIESVQNQLTKASGREALELAAKLTQLKRQVRAR